MHHLTHMSGHMDFHNIQMSQSQNQSIGFAATSNPLHSNQNYTTNIGDVHGARVVHYNRVSQIETKNSHQMNNFQNMRQQRQQIFRKTHQYQQHAHVNFQPKKNHKRDQHSENKLPNQFCLQKSNVPRTRDNTSLRIKTEEKIEKNYSHQITQQNIETLQYVNSTDTSSIEPQTNLLVKNREIPSKLLSYDNEKDTTCADVSTDVNTYSNKEEQYHHEELIETNTKDQVFNKYDKTMEEEESMGSSNQTSNKNTREKTAMCLINDLARYNKIAFQYRLTSENGPAHCKRFTVTLKLGDEEYTAEEFKIKKAQHLAAKEAIENTKYKHPVPKINRRSEDQSVMRTNITPTVELNALAMKLGQQTYYIFDPRQMTTSESDKTKSENDSQINLKTTNSNDSSGHFVSPPSVMINRDHNKAFRSGNLGGTFLPSLALSESLKRGHKSDANGTLPKFPIRFPTFQPPLQNGLYPNPLVSTYFPLSSPCRITLIIGKQKFVGIGRTLQQAKHDAATNALKVLKVQISTQHNDDNDESFDENEIKSPISLVFEFGIKRNLPVDFKVLREEGPAHMRSFTTACIVGHILTEGEGTGKKISKKKAAQKMLEELKKLPPLTSTSSPLKRAKLKANTKKLLAPCVNFVSSTETKMEQQRLWNRNKKLITDADSSNPITKLIEWHQQNKEKEPLFKLISEIGKEHSRRRQFVVEVSSNKAVARGVGNSKKNAKRDAAQNFLLAIGLNDLGSRVSENQKLTEMNNVVNKEDKSSNFEVNQSHSNNSGSVVTYTKSKEIKDVIKSIIMPQFQKGFDISDINDTSINQLETKEVEKSLDKSGSHDDGGIDNFGRCAQRNNEVESSLFTTTTSAKSTGRYMKDHLLYLAKLLGFEVDFSDYPKGNHNEFLTIVMLSTSPPQICHGVGVNAKESQDDAAKNALKILSEMGLNNAMKS